jgi:hypothetical protein
MATKEVVANPEYLRLLWDGLHQALRDGMDTADVAAVSRAIERLAEDRLLWLAHHGGSAPVVAWVRDYRDKAAELAKSASRTPPDLDFEKLAEKRAATWEGSGGERVAGRS